MKNKKHVISLLLGASSFVLIGGSLLGLSHFLNSPQYRFEKETGGTYCGATTEEKGTTFVKKHLVPTDPKYATQKTQSMNIVGDIEGAWDKAKGAGTKIAIIDDGFCVSHEEYKRLDGTSAIDNESAYFYTYESGSSYYVGVKYYKNDSTCLEEEWDSDYQEWGTHGTMTSTTAAAPINGKGGVGIAPEADILALKIDMSFGAIEYAIEYAIDQGVDVINMSLGAYAESFTDGWGDKQSGSSSVATYLDDVCKKAYDNNIIVVASAGNEATYHKSYPACNSHVIGVGALESGDDSKLAAFTNYVKSTQTGEINVDILAPGFVHTACIEGSKSSSYTKTYSDTQGTSFSSPIVAGAAALWKQLNPSGTPDQFLEKLQSSAKKIGEYKNKYVPVSEWDSSRSNVGPSAITAGSLDVGALLTADKELTSIEITSKPETLSYYDELSVSSYKLTLNYDDGSSEANVTPTSVSFADGNDSKSLGEKQVKVYYGETYETTSIFVTNVGATQKATGGTGEKKTSTFTSSNAFTASNQTKTVGDLSWTLVDDGGYHAFSSTNGQQIGSKSSPASSTTLTSSSLSAKTISKVSVSALVASSGNTSVSVKVGNTSFLCNGSSSVALTTTKTTYDFVGTGTGNIVVSFATTAKAFYISSIVVTQAGSVTYNFDGAAQAASTIAYLQGIPTCYSAENKQKMVSAVNEYNAMIDAAKTNDMWNQTFLDNGGYTTSSIDKIKAIVAQYNANESVKLTLELPTGSYQGVWNISSVEQGNGNALLTMLLISCVVVSSVGLFAYNKRRKK